MMLTFILEAALRSLLMALAVWAAIRLLRVQAVLAQKVAWVMVLLAAGAMPLVMHTPWLALNRAIRIPMRSVQMPKLLGMPALLARWRGASSAVPKQTPAAQAMVKLQPYTPAWKLALPAQPHVAASSHLSGRAHTAISMVKIQTVKAQTPAISGRDAFSDAFFSSRVLDLPMAPMDVSVTLASSVTHQAKFWTASRLKLVGIAAYFVVVCLLLLRTILGLVVAVRVLRRAKRVHGFTDDDGRPLKVRVSRDLMTPVTIGSTIVLPADYAEWDAEKLRVVLAHEQSHVRQGDFYLQLLAAAHAAVFWFSPLGWWLKAKLSDLGEALSDHAGLEKAPDAATYAQVLLEFAAKPRPKAGFAPLAGVAMARSSNLSSRIERILNDRRFRLAFLGGRRHAAIAVVLVPTALVAAVGGIRIVPVVEAHQSVTTPAVAACKGTSGQVAAVSYSGSDGQAVTAHSGQAPAPAVAPVPSAAPDPSAAPQVAVTPIAPEPDVEAPVAVAAPAAPAVEAVTPQAPDAQEAPAPDVKVKNHEHDHVHVWVNHQDDDGDSFSIVHENGDGSVRWNGEYNDDLAQVRKRMNLHGDYIWFEHDGKSYVITDPVVLAQANKLFRHDESLDRLKAQLDAKQAELNKRMEQYSPDAAKLKMDSPEMKKQMAELNAKLAELQSEKFKQLTVNLNKQIDQEVLAHLQEKMGEIQEQIGQVQGQIGEEMGRLGEKQGEIGEEMGRVGEEMGRIGEQEGKRAEDASRQMKSVLEQALRDGKAKPVE
jgi:beta-lactamase regulating signal transducer with metallopeptidase domain